MKSLDTDLAKVRLRMISCSHVSAPILFAYTFYRVYCCENVSIRILMGLLGMSQVCSDSPCAIPCSYLASIAYLRINPRGSALGRYFLSISIPLNMLSAGVGYSPGLINPVFAVIVGNWDLSLYRMVLQVGAMGCSLLSSSLSCVLLLESFAEYDKSLV